MEKLKELGYVLGSLIATGVVIAAIASIAGFNWGHTQKGTINIDYKKCIAHVELQKGDWTTYFHKFYCGSYGYCDAVEIHGDQCTANYYYKTDGSTSPVQNQDLDWDW